MKLLLTIGLILLTVTGFSQTRSYNFNQIDKNVFSANSDDPATLSFMLTGSLTTEGEKVRAIFRWIAENISYYRNVPSFKKHKKRGRNNFDVYDEEPEDTGALKPLTERVALKVLKDRKTYCEGYARLFKSLCDHAGIKAEIITGYARTDMNRIEKNFRSNHSWNAVRIDSAWYLLDVTWASGYITTFSGEFVKRFDDYYFLTPPEEFIKHHYPDNIGWSLLESPDPLYEFRYTPFKQKSFVKYSILDYSPSKGIIEASVGDTLRFELSTAIAYKNISMATDSLWDSAALIYSPFLAYIKPDMDKKEKKTSYIYPVESDMVQWLYIMYNNDAVLRYRLNVKKANAAR